MAHSDAATPNKTDPRIAKPVEEEGVEAEVEPVEEEAVEPIHADQAEGANRGGQNEREEKEATAAGETSPDGYRVAPDANEKNEEEEPLKREKGREGIRTLDLQTDTSVFKTGALDHSATRRRLNFWGEQRESNPYLRCHKPTL